MNMIRYIILFLFSATISFTASGQSLEGDWEGTYSVDEYNYLNIRNEFFINLYFQLNSDSTYTVYSTSYFNKGEYNESKAICLMTYKMIGTDSIYLEEIKDLQSGNDELDCFQRMKLKIVIKKNQMRFIGIWDSTDDSCGKGTIGFRKKIKK